METISEAKSETINAIPSGARSLPSIPDKKNKGTNATMIIRVALMIEVLISIDALKITFNLPSRSSGGFLEFSFSRLYTFSTSMIASSTSAPIAIAIPPRLIVLIVRPNHFKVRIAIISEIGIAIIEIAVARQFIRKTNRIIITNNEPSIRVLLILLMEASIKSACLNMFVLIFTSSGNHFLRSRMVLSIFSVSSIVFVDGCFITVITIAGLPFTEASPIFVDEPILISETSSIFIG